MTADDFKAWRERMHYSQRKAALVLGCSAATVAAYEAGQKIPRYVALACGAVSYGLPPMGETQ